jgi:putative PIN family toxin of toxin-antitoxin system
MKIVLDSNVYIAAFLAKGLASDILKFGEKGKIEIYTSREILDEVKEKLVSKGKLDEVFVKQLLSHIEKSLKIVKLKRKLNVVKEDPDDNKILECAIVAGANLIVTMDKHLLKLKSYENIGIVHPKTLTWIIPKLIS